jgi:gamma-glutamyl-gamma-aminobutyrate hydrolase PuuD
VLAALDGLIVTGGPDVDPRLYGALPHSETDSPREERDAWEMALCRGALERDLPLLAICRGLQVLNVSMDGTLHQHLPEVLGSNAHRATPGQMTANRVALIAGSAVASILGAETEGSCHHHQAIDRLGRRVQAVGFAGDGTVEAVEVEGNDFAIGVQWHPEDDQDDDRLFVALVEAASRYRDTRAAGPVPSVPGPGRP